MERIDSIRDERGTTLVEVMVATASGLVVLSALTMVVLVTLHGSARVTARVHATQNARITLARVMEQLHSACVTPKIAPIQEKSTGTLLRFIHTTGSEGTKAAPIPTLSEISLNDGVLSQTDFAATNTAQPWTFSSTPTSPTPRQLMTNVAPVPPNTSIFNYFAYTNGAPSQVPLNTPEHPTLEPADAAIAVQVKVAFTVAPGSTPVADVNAPATIQDTAALRLTPPSFNSEAVALPCQ